MLKMTRLLDLALGRLGANDNEVVGGSSKADETIKNLSKSKKLKNTKSKILTHANIGVMRELIFVTPQAKEVFIQLR